jgi:hydrogenase maturation protein HypF
VIRETRVRASVAIRGAVQGVGFRPFVFRLASALGLDGWVRNAPSGVSIEAEGHEGAVGEFLLRLEREKPPLAFIQSLETRLLDPAGLSGFVIRASEESGEKSALVLPDVATCPECLREIFDPSDRRHLYPFTNCTNCGPRFSIIEALPYDRSRTTMRKFPLCDACRAEYEDPRDRRFHAEPNACPACGPRLELRGADGAVRSRRHEALLDAAGAIRSGGVLALKGLGGFHLVVDARNEEAVRLLRERKRREEKPLAVMAPSLESATAFCAISEPEARLLRSSESPIVLLRKNGAGGVAPSVAPRNPYLGVMLPYTPLHHILLRELGFPVVATSGNLSDEPICTDEEEALERLGGIADLFLVHDRPIARHVDDSVARVTLGRELVVRRARGYAPLPVRLPGPVPEAVAVGAHYKSAVAVARRNEAFVGQHIGDLETVESFDAFRRSIDSLAGLHGIRPSRAVCDLHPDYRSTRHAESLGLPVTRVQHHHAHTLSCMAENELEGTALGVAWDGTGYGPDGSVWGGEFLVVSGGSFRRVASLRPFRLPGGDAAAREPRRSALGVLHEILGPAVFEREDLAPVRAFPPEERAVLRRMLDRGLQCPETTSAGRLFDAASSIAGIRQTMSFEGQAPMEFEFAIGDRESGEEYPFRVERGADRDLVDWEPLVRALLDDAAAGLPAGVLAVRFHNALAAAILAVARAAGEKRVLLTGGCFQNEYLLVKTVRVLEADGFQPYRHQRVPPNDGGIALGQLAALARTSMEEGPCA